MLVVEGKFTEIIIWARGTATDRGDYGFGGWS